MMTKSWKRLAEAFGINEANWDKVAKQRNMQRYGTQDRRDKGQPVTMGSKMPLSTSQLARQAQAAARRPPIPSGTDRPGQGNPMFDPPKRGLSAAPNSPAAQMPMAPPPGGGGGASPMAPTDDHHMSDPDWLDMLQGDDEGDDDPNVPGATQL